MIQCDPNSIVPHFSSAEMESMRRMLSLGIPGFEFDHGYEAQVRTFNGGRPVNRYFQTRSGQGQPIDRFLNYSDTDLLTERHLQDLNANVLWSLIDDQLGGHLLPFAVLAGGDLLCFDYERGVPPEVVLWYHEVGGMHGTKVEPVAGSFAEFAASLTASPVTAS